jgi:hypothetical protein
MGAGAFHGRVRDGIGCGSPAMATGSPDRSWDRQMKGEKCSPDWSCGVRAYGGGGGVGRRAQVRVRPFMRWELSRAIRTARLRRSPGVHLRPIDVVVFHGPRGDLVWRGVSRLDAFSGYPVRAWLPGGAAGATTGAPEARPSRSSRTGDGASQISCARGR